MKETAQPITMYDTLSIVSKIDKYNVEQNETQYLVHELIF